MEKEQKSYIIEGFPRTELQAISLRDMGIIPDKFLLLNQGDEYSESKILHALSQEDSVVKCDQAKRARLAKAAICENNIHMAAVRKVCQGFVTELDGTKNET